ncbi:MAG: hypothetical protein J5626_00065 [Lachnospiraceae bacterium]|nr:hypothetical protein [Lachnospiraceae bacterium]
MTREEKLESVLKSYMRYYTIIRDDVTAPFDAEAEFISHNEQYILIKSAKIADIDSNEFVFFKTEERLTSSNLSDYEKIAWETGLSRVVPGPGHRNSDVTLVIIADHIDEDAFKLVKNIKHSKSYKFTFHGWSNFKLIAIDLSNGRLTYNRHGQTLKKVINNK